MSGPKYGIDEARAFKPVRIAVLTVSDTRTPETDSSGATLAARIETAGHAVAARALSSSTCPSSTSTVMTAAASK